MNRKRAPSVPAWGVLGALALALIGMPNVSAQPAEQGAAWAATVTYVVDGDSIWVRSAARGARVKLRLLGIDAPEVCQTLGPQARAALQQMAQGRAVRVSVRARDRYGRALAKVVLADDGRDLSQAMVRAGWAWADVYSWHRAVYEADETSAREGGRGVFRERDPERPGDFRRRHGSCVPPKP